MRVMETYATMLLAASICSVVVAFSPNSNYLHNFLPTSKVTSTSLGINSGSYYSDGQYEGHRSYNAGGPDSQLRRGVNGENVAASSWAGDNNNVNSANRASYPGSNIGIMQLSNSQRRSNNRNSQRDSRYSSYQVNWEIDNAPPRNYVSDNRNQYQNRGRVAGSGSMSGGNYGSGMQRRGNYRDNYDNGSFTAEYGTPVGQKVYNTGNYNTGNYNTGNYNTGNYREGPYQANQNGYREGPYQANQNGYREGLYRNSYDNYDYQGSNLPPRRTTNPGAGIMSLTRPQSDRYNRNDQQNRYNRNDQQNRYNRNDQQNRYNRNDQQNRYNRNDQQNRYNRNDQQNRYNRNDQQNRYNRNDQQNKYSSYRVNWEGGTANRNDNGNYRDGSYNNGNYRDGSNRGSYGNSRNGSYGGNSRNSSYGGNSRNGSYGGNSRNGSYGGNSGNGSYGGNYNRNGPQRID